ncbi:hypothetical protein SD70_04325 [Gordoniibacillus kamchatkensis]|uniref:Intimin n=1 Tax=Gordoniibacillus kamchatkensis TaxID=1590651 RepID=A0ABR5ALE5_9BACL|nr:hypothetical protein SD70_04325 [Paenibacillus sp. VKM B-2647]
MQASPSAGAVASGTQVTLSTTTVGAAVYYTTDGSTPTTGSTLYSGPITITANTTIKAFAVKSGMTNSNVGSFVFTATSNLSNLTVDEGKYNLVVNGTHQTIVDAIYQDQSIKDVTRIATYTISDTTVILVDSNGVVTAKKTGIATITATYGGKTVTVTVTVQTSEPNFTLSLQTSPSSVVGDGKSKVSVIGNIVSKTDGKPVAGVPIQFHFGNGSNNDLTAVTDASGNASVIFTAPSMTGLNPVLEMIAATATEPGTGLTTQKSITISYMPASVKGVLIDQITGKPIAGAIVSVTADFNGDGVIDFSATVTTGADGSYQIYVPRGDWDYTMSIQTSVQVGNKTVPLNMTQTAHVGSLTGTGQDVIAPENNISGQLTITKSGSTGSQASVGSLFGTGNVSAVVQGTAGNSYSKQVKLNSDGSFNVENVPQGQYIIAYQIKAADGTTLAGPLATVNVSQNGQMSIVYSLIDPDGIVTDSLTGLPVSGVNMNLYWADTTPNRQNGHTPNTLVNLPDLTNFAPNQNHNPQATDANGAYAWLVYPNADYYIVATKDGYYSYSTLVAKPNVPAVNGSDSYIQDGIIHVGQSLVSLNFSLTALPTSSSGSSHSSVQSPLHLAASNVTQTGVLLTWDEVSGADSYTIYENGQSIAKGVASGSYQVTGLAKGTAYSFTVTAVAGNLESAVSNAISVTTLLEAATAPANETEKGEHEKYIEGYPDGTFKPERNVTRQEVAAMLFRVYHLTKSGLTGKMYSDVTNADWGAGEIEAVSKAGIMNGYPDGTFRPNQPITREEMAATVARLKQLQSKGMDAFSDITDSWARESINAANQAGFIAGYANGTFRPKANSTRAEVVTMINHLANRGPLYGVDTPTWSDVGTNYWAYRDIEEASTNHHFIIQDKKEMRVEVKK